MSSYPTDRKSCGYSIRFIRWLLDSGRVNQIGPDSFTLLVAIVTMEDQLHYERAPDFWREQLLSRCGMKSVHSLISARQRAVDAGLLYHKPGTKSVPGVYFTTGFHAESAQKVNGKRTESEQNTATSIPSTQYPKKDTASLDFSDEDIQTAKWMFSLIQKLHPSHKPPSFEKWASSIRLMREREKRTDSEIRRLFAAANSDSFWQKNILGPDKLRKQWDKLVIALKASSSSTSEYKPFVPSTTEDPIKPKRRSV